MAHHEIGSFASFLVTRLGNLLIQEYRFLHGVKAQVEQMQTELNLMQCYLKAADTKREDGDEIVRNLYAEIRELSFDAEDVIATFLVKVARKSRGGIFNESRARHKVGLEIEDINKKIAHFTKSLKRYGTIPSTDALGELSTSRSERERELRRSYAHVFEEDIVGFDNDVIAVVDKLVKEKINCRVVAIWGMGGLGKTTLAKMIYTNYDVRRHFDCIAWAYISQQCKTREVLEEILIQLLMPISEKERKEIENLKIAELTEKLHRVQSQKKCLVILDDIWECESWARLSPGFPNTKGVVGSKILLTTRIREVALYVDQQCFLHELRLLTEKESWELFQKKASPKREEFRLSKEMMVFGKDMLKQCGGLPLAIVVLGGLLATKRTLGDWEKVSKSVDYLRKGKGPGEDLATSVLAISYNDLPYHLKACFLCLSDLPGDEGIRHVKLVQKWIAEGFVSLPIPARVGEVQEETMLVVGISYLHELYQRCMIQVSQLTRFSRRVKFYRLHDLMRDLCLLKAQEENFIKVLMGEDSATASSSSTPSRRLAVYYRDNQTVGDSRRTGYVKPHKMDKIWNHHKVRSCQFYFFGNKLEDSDWRHIESIIKGFELLTFLDLERTTFSGKEKKLPKAIGNLIHLRYLSTRDSEIVSLLSSIGDLEFLQTLDLRNIYYTITIANELWRLKELRHLYLPQNIVGPFVGKLRLDGLSKLETLEGFKADNCDDRCFSTLTNLRQLGISRAAPKDLAVILKSPSLCNSNGLLRYSSFNILGGKYIQSQEDLSLLRQLLGYRHLHKLKLFGSMNLSKLPDQFYPNLTKLILEESELEKDPMPTLEKLPNLRFLALDRDSYTGRKMVCSTPTPTTSSSLSGGGYGYGYGYGYAAAGFPQLKYLRLNGINNLEEWRLEKGAMPTLFRLQVKACLKLKEIPNGLRFVSTLQELVIDNVSQELQDRLKADLYIVQHVPSIKIEQGIP